MNWFPLPIFPEGSLASSVITAVWVGVVVFSLMNLRFGWTYSGLVVPGYLVPLMIAKPWAAVIIVCESFLTLWTVLAITLLLPKMKVACAFFGRDRFLAMILVSVVYRVVLDAWLLPALGKYLADTHGLHFDYQNNLHSFGLIVICLAANQLWKTGVVKGLGPFAFNIIATYLIVRFVLMEFTNFSISNLSFLYEDIAASIYAAPKAYIVLITTSILASRMNLRYGWDFNGIMIPALIALQWFEPTKVLTSIVEALVILGASMLLLRLPLFASVTVEGARKLLLFFTVSFVYKMIVGWGMLFIAPEIKVSDFYGFGYLLPTLIAIKMHHQHKIVHQLRITLQISLVSVLVATAIGFLLTLIPEGDSRARPSLIPVPEPRTYPSEQFDEVVLRSFVDFHAALLNPERPEPRQDALHRFGRGLQALTLGREADTLERAGQELAMAGFRMDRIGGRYLHIRALDPASGRPLLVIDLQTASRLVVSCPQALQDRDSFQAATRIFAEQQARVLFIGDPLPAEKSSRFQRNRPLPSWSRRALEVLGPEIQVERARGDASVLYVERSLPESLDLKRIEDRFGSFEARWASPPGPFPLERGSCRLVLSPSAILQSAGPEQQISALPVPIDAFIRDTLPPFAPKGSNLYAPPTSAELLYLDRHVLQPLFRLGQTKLGAELARIASAAAPFGFRLVARRHAGDTFVLLFEETPQRHWGSVLVRLGDNSAPVCLQVASRVDDQSLLSFAATQFKRLEARALISAGSNSLTNSDGSASLASLAHRESFFNLAHQTFVRTAGEGALVLQCRAFVPAPGEPYPSGDIIIAPYRENRGAEETAVAVKPVLDLLASDGVAVREVGEADSSSPYAVGLNAQAKYLDFTGRADFAILWLSPFLRENYRAQGENDALLKQLQALEIPLHEVPLAQFLSRHPWARAEEIQETLKQSLRVYRQDSDILVLQNLGRQLSLEAILDPASGQLFLACGPHLVANLARQAFDRSLTPSELQTFIDSRAAWLETP